MSDQFTDLGLGMGQQAPSGGGASQAYAYNVPQFASMPAFVSPGAMQVLAQNINPWQFSGPSGDPGYLRLSQGGGAASMAMNMAGMFLSQQAAGWSGGGLAGNMFGVPNFAQTMSAREEYNKWWAINSSSMAPGGAAERRVQAIFENMSAMSGNRDPAWASGMATSALGMLNGSYGPMGASILGSMGIDIYSLISPASGMSHGLFPAMQGGVTPMSVGRMTELTQLLGQNYFFDANGRANLSNTYGWNGNAIGTLLSKAAENNLISVSGYRETPAFTSKLADFDEQMRMNPARAQDIATQRQAFIDSDKSERDAGMTRQLEQNGSLFRAAAIFRGITNNNNPEDAWKMMQIVSGGTLETVGAQEVEKMGIRFQELVKAARVSAEQMAYLISEGGKLSQRAGHTAAIGAAAAFASGEFAVFGSDGLNGAFTGASAFNMGRGAMAAAWSQLGASAARSPQASVLSGIIGTMELNDLGPNDPRLSGHRLLTAAAAIRQGTATPEQLKMLDVLNNPTVKSQAAEEMRAILHGPAEAYNSEMSSRMAIRLGETMGSTGITQAVMQRIGDNLHDRLMNLRDSFGATGRSSLFAKAVAIVSDSVHGTTGPGTRSEMIDAAAHTQEERDSLTTMIGMLETRASRMVGGDDRLRAIESYRSPKAMAAREAWRQRLFVQGDIQRVLAVAGGGDLLNTAMDAMANPNADLSTIISDIGGSLNMNSARGQAVISGIDKRIKELQGLEKDPRASGRARADYAESIKKLREMRGQITADPDREEKDFSGPDGQGGPGSVKYGFDDKTLEAGGSRASAVTTVTMAPNTTFNMRGTLVLDVSGGGAVAVIAAKAMADSGPGQPYAGPVADNGGGLHL